MQAQHSFSVKALIVLLSAVILCIVYSVPVSASPVNNTRTVTVAYPLQDGLTDLDENGNYCGYTYEYLQEISQYTGWDYEFIQTPDGSNESLTKIMEKVQNGEIDLMGGMLYMEELNDQYTFSGQSYGTVETVLQTISDSANPIIINSQIMQHMRIAVLNTTGRSIRELEDFCRMNKIEPEYITCSDDIEQLEALREGRADALLNTSLNYMEGVRTIARFSPKPFYFVTGRQGDASLMDELSMALLNIQQSDPYFSTSLFEKYFVSQEETLHFSEEDSAYIEQAEPIKVGILTDQPPYQFYDEKIGRLNGISVDLLDLITELSGLSFEYLPVSTNGQLYELADEGGIDLLAAVTYDYDFSREHHLALTRPYLSSQYMRVMNQNVSSSGIDNKRLALSSSTSYSGYTVGQVTVFDNRSDCIRAVKNAEADYTYVDACTAQYYINQPEFWGLKMVPLAYDPIRISLGAPKPADQELLTVLNKVIRAIPVEKIQMIITENTYPEQAFSYSDMMRAHPLETIAVISAVLILIFVLALLLFYQNIRSNRQASIDLKKRLRVYALANDYFFEYSFHKQNLVISLPSAREPDGVEMLEFRYKPVKEGEDGEQPAGGAEAYKAFWDLIQSEENGSFECYQLCRDGQWHWLRITLEVIRHGAVPAFTIGKFNLIDEEKEEKNDLEAKASLDGLTGIYNIRACRMKIEEALASMGEEESGAFLLLDIDHFKTINDSFGHIEGDRILCLLADTLKKNIRPEDIIGRFGGDEFIIYLCNMKDEETLNNRCEIICRTLRQDSRASGCPITISMGAVMSFPGSSYENLFEAADRELYWVKEQGRDGFHIAGQSHSALGRKEHE